MKPTTITELKHLQKEIDEASKVRDYIISSIWVTMEGEKQHTILGDKIETNQQKIKEIIESL